MQPVVMFPAGPAVLDDLLGMLDQRRLVELTEVDLLDGEVARLDECASTTFPIGHHLSPRPFDPRSLGCSSPSAELRMEAADGFQDEPRRQVLGRAIGSDQWAQPCVHEAVHEPAIEGVGRRAELGEHLAEAGRHRLGLDVLDQWRLAADEM